MTVATQNRARAWAWVAHLRAGGSTPWADWTSADAADEGRLLPGAQQLELLRRLNEIGRPSAELAERVLVASAPGRGRQDLELLGAVEPSSFGPRPVDPATLRPDELTRVAVGLVALDVVAAGEAMPEPTRPRRWRTRYRISGDPWLAGRMRDELVDRGHPPGGRGAVVAVLGTDLATMVRHTWLARCFADGGPDWERFCLGIERRGTLPPRVALDSLAQRWAESTGRPGQVRIVTDPQRLARVVGVRRLATPGDVAADPAELSRRVAGALGVLVTPPRQAELLRRVLLPRVSGLPGGPARLPEDLLDLLEEQAVRMRRRLSAGDYPVEGDLDALLLRRSEEPAGAAAVADEQQPERVLSLAMGLLLDPARADGAAVSRP